MSDTIDITCPHCLQTLEADESLVGETVACPGCGQEFRVEKRICDPSTPTPEDAETAPEPKVSIRSKTKTRTASRRNAARRSGPGAAGSVTRKRQNKKRAWIVTAVLSLVLAAVAISYFALSPRRYKREFIVRSSDRREAVVCTEDQKRIAGLICAAARLIGKTDTNNAKYIAEKCGETSPEFLFVLECAFRRETIERLAEWIGRMSSQTGPGPERVEQAWQLLAKSGSANAFRTLLDSAFVDGADSPIIKAFSNNEDGIRDSLCRSAKNWMDTCRGSIELVFEACHFCGLDTTDDSSADRMANDAVASSVCAEIDEAIEFSTPFFGTPEHAVRILYEIVEGREFDVHSRIKPNGKWIEENLPNSGLAIPGAARSAQILLETACSELRKNGISSPSLVRRMVADGLTGTLSERKRARQKQRLSSSESEWIVEGVNLGEVKDAYGNRGGVVDRVRAIDEARRRKEEANRALLEEGQNIAQSPPSRVTSMRVRSIAVEPFPFFFDGVKMKGADGSYKFTVKDAKGRDWYVKKNQELANTGFVLKDYSSVVEERYTSTGIRKVEVFTLVFGKNGEQIVMEAGTKPDFCFYKVTFVCGKDVYEVYLNEKFDLDGDTFKLLSVDQETRTAKLECESNKKVVEVPAETNRIRSWNWD